MARILVYEPAFRRIEQRLPPSADGQDMLLLRRDGTIWHGDRELSRDEAQPEIGWTSTDLFDDPPAMRAYFIALLKSARLMWLQSGAAGFDNQTLVELVRKGARLTNNHSQGAPMADYVLWGVLDHLQRGPERRAAQAGRRWEEHPFTEMGDTRWLLIGFGAIGQAVARRARAFGAHVTGVRRTPGAHELADAMAAPETVKDLLSASDVVVLSTPLNPETAHMVDADFLERMKPGSVLANVGRGGLVDEAALLAALDAGAPAHALLDVFETEPLPADSPFWSHPRVSLTPHASALGSGVNARTDALFLENLGRFLDGRPLLNAVDSAEVLANAKGG
ncbi:MAG: D-2-hydroxyacid dehydrogenase [Caulobacteraceae bacterium]|nr:D-2-hydroxyacid dehydrogenase [Caulobacteraceae bacterium]